MTDNEVANLGGKLGPRAAKLVADAMVYTRQKLGDHQNQLAQKILADFTNHVSDEVQGVMGQVWDKLATAEETPAELRPVFEALATQQGQAFGWIGGSIAGTTMSAGLFDLINNWMAPVIHSLIAAVPNSFLSPETVAAAKAKGIHYVDEPRSLDYDAQGNGINPQRLGIMQQLAESWPTVNMLQDLRNRGEITDAQALHALLRNGFQSDNARRLLNSRVMLLSPAELATMVNRDVVSEREGKQRAAHSGLPEEDFEKLAEIYGEPLGAAALGEAFRRGFIDRATFERGIIQGPLRKEWFPVLERLQYSRMSTVDAADAVNQGHMQLAEAQEVATANGLDPTDFATLITLAGIPPGVDFITEALNRGLIDEQTFTEAFLESRVKNKYVGLYAAMRLRLIPQETVRLLYRNGVYSREATLDTLRKHGFSPTDAESLIALEEARQDETTKELTRSQIIDLYEVRAISLESTLEMLFSLGYSDNNARAMIELADLQRLQKYINSAVTRVKSAYLAGRMTETEASAQLDGLGIPVDQRDDLFMIWDIDRTTITKTLTPAQIRQAFKKDLVSQSDALARLTAQGYDGTDAALYLQLTA